MALTLLCMTIQFKFENNQIGFLTQYNLNGKIQNNILRDRPSFLNYVKVAQRSR